MCDSPTSFREGEVYREKGEWGARLKDATGTHIIVAMDPARFFACLTAT